MCRLRQLTPRHDPFVVSTTDCHQALEFVVAYNPNQTVPIAMLHPRRPSPIGCAATRRPLCLNSDQATANTAGSKTSVSRRTLLAAMR